MKSLSLACIMACVVMIAWGIFLAVMRDWKLRARAYLCLAVGYALHGIAGLLIGERAWVCVDAALVAWALYMWWNSGGGDGLKRRLRSFSAYLGFGPRLAGQSV